MSEPSSELVSVWDPFVRIGHWLLVITFAMAYLLGDDLLWLHTGAGYVLGLVVAFRVVWGFVGPRRSRFSDFAYGPWAALTYCVDLINLRGRRYVGHSPAGGIMIISTLAILSAVVYTGLMTYALERNRGPLAPFVFDTPAVAAGTVPGAEPAAATEWKRSDDPDARHRREFWDRLHKRLSNLTLILIMLHIGGVALASYAHDENLVQAMFTGKKRPEQKP